MEQQTAAEESSSRCTRRRARIGTPITWPGSSARALAALCVSLFHPEPFEYTFFPLELTAAFVLGAGGPHPRSSRRCGGSSRRASCEKNVRTSANAAFVELGVFRTKGRTGILVYVATFEKRVVVVRRRRRGSRGARARVGKGARGARSLRARRHPARSRPRSRRLGPLLSRALPRQADDVNELEDAVRA
ncbi:MAG: hypothetical protein V9F82_00075 [Dermatophilaceae bacterium]